MNFAPENPIKLNFLKLSNSNSLREDWRLISLVIIFALGILIKLQFHPFELPSYILAILFIGVLTTSIPLKASNRVHLYAAAAFILGIASAQFKLEQLPQQTVERETFVQLNAVVKSIEYRIDRPTRITLEVRGIDKEQWLVGQNIRLIVRTEIPDGLYAGTRVTANAVLGPSPGAIVPNGFNFGQYNRFKGIAGQGFAASAIKVEKRGPPDSQFQNYIENTRSQLSSTILDNIDQPLGGIAVALITGQRQQISPKTAADIRDAGLAHLLAISGLHMGLITGAAFFIFEIIFASIGTVALRVTPRKLAAVAAWACALIYLGLSGAGTSTIRAFIMVSVAILAVLTDRRVLSLRSVAIAAFIILLISPDALLGSGFQMSFAATIGIVVSYDYLALWRQSKGDDKIKGGRSGLFTKIVFYFFSAAGTSLIAQLAVGPIALYHFQTFSLVGIIANVIAIPLMAFLVMPSAFLAILLSTIGFEAPLLAVMGWGLSLIAELATALAAIPMSVIATTPYGIELLFSVGIALAILMVWRNTFSLVIAISFVLLSLQLSGERPADVLIAGQGTIIAERGLAGNPAIFGGRRGGFRDDAWKRYWGHREREKFQTLDRSCDSRTCQTTVHFYTKGQGATQIPVVVSKSLETTRQACNSGFIVIASYTHKRFCRGALEFFSSEDVEKYGPIGLWSKKTSENTMNIRYQWSNPPTRNK